MYIVADVVDDVIIGRVVVDEGLLLWILFGPLPSFVGLRQSDVSAGNFLPSSGEH